MTDQYLVFPGADEPSSSYSSTVVVPPLSDRSEKLFQVLNSIPDIIESDDDSDENDLTALVPLQSVDSASPYPLQNRIQISELSDTLNNLDQLSFSLERLIIEKLDQLDAREIEINEELQEIRRLIDVGENLNYNKTSMSCFGMPYFKTSKLNPFPPNQDYLSKVANDELITYDLPMSSFWTANEIVTIQGAVAGEIIERELEKVSISLESTIKSPVERKIEHQKAWAVWNNKPLSELVADNNDQDFDWYRIATYNFRDRHSPEECKRMWHLYAKPSIIKARWSKEEDTSLIEIAKKKNHQNWEAIAQELNTGRSGYQCFVQYKQRLAPLKKVGRWTLEEDKLLCKIVEQCRIGAYIPWSKVMYYFENRSLRQLFNRWNYSLNPNLKKGHFTRSEDFGLCVGVQLYGKNFNKIASILGNRSSSQIRERYKSKMADANCGSWSKEEDLKLIELYEKFGDKKWSQVSKHLCRTRTQCRLRYGRLKNKYNFDLDIIRRNVKYKPLHIYEKAWFKQYFTSSRDEKTLLDVSKNLSLIRKRGRKGKSGSVIENQLIDFFLESFIDPTTYLSRALHISDETKLMEAAEVIIQILRLFKANISFPKNISESYIRFRDTNQIANDGLISLIMHVAKLYKLEEGASKSETFTVDNDNDFAESYDLDDDFDIAPKRSIEYDYSIVDPSTTKMELCLKKSYNQASMTSLIQGDLKEFYIEPKPEECTHRDEQNDVATESTTINLQHCSNKPSSLEDSKNEAYTAPPPELKTQVDYLLPPNALSMVALRTYMLARKKLWKMISLDSEEKSSRNKLSIPAPNRKKLTAKEASEFAVARFTSLLFWPLFLSSHSPSKLGFIKPSKMTGDLTQSEIEDNEPIDEMFFNEGRSDTKKSTIRKNVVSSKVKSKDERISRTKENKCDGVSSCDPDSKSAVNMNSDAALASKGASSTQPISSRTSSTKKSSSTVCKKRKKNDSSSNSDDLLKSSSKTKLEGKRPAVVGLRRSGRIKQPKLTDSDFVDNEN